MCVSLCGRLRFVLGAKCFLLLIKNDVLRTMFLPFVRGLSSQHNVSILFMRRKLTSTARPDLENILKLYINGTFSLEFSFKCWQRKQLF